MACCPMVALRLDTDKQRKVKYENEVSRGGELGLKHHLESSKAKGLVFHVSYHPTSYDGQ